MRGFRSGIDYLVDTCPHIRRVVDTCGRPKSRKRSPGFATLSRIIVDQQVSVQAGAAIWARLEAGCGGVTPETVQKIGIDGLRACGLSGAKARYVSGIADAVVDGGLNLNGLSRKRDEDAREILMALKGIGRWTADIYLMFALGRPDIMPSGDIALQAAAGRLFRINPRPGPEALDELAQRWSPYRSVAAIMLWHAYKRMPADT